MIHAPPRVANRASALAICALMLLASSACWPAKAAAQTKPAWTCLPDTTAAFARVPAGRAVFEAIRANTQFGRVLLSPERLEKIRELVLSQAEEQAHLATNLARFGLKPDDFLKVLDGEAGYALTVEGSGKEAVFVGLAWIEPGEDVAARLFEALQKVVVEPGAREAGVRRVDSTLAGQAVTRLAIPITRTRIDFGNGGDKIRDPIDRGKAKAPKRVTRQTDQINFSIARLGGRLLVAHTFEVNGSRIRAAGVEAADASKLDYDLLTGVNEATRAFGKFLSAHSAGSGSNAVAALVNAPGVNAVLPKGQTVVEAYVNVPRLHEIGMSMVDAENRELLNAYGQDTVGPLAYRMTLDGPVLRQTLFAAVPAPRSGINAVWDQPPGLAEIPAWVPASAQEYAHVNVNLAAAWKKVREILSAATPNEDPTREMAKNADAALQGIAGVDIAGLLATIGNQHAYVGFPSETPAAAVEEKRLDEGPVEGRAFGGDRKSPRFAFVLQVNDEAPWAKLIELGTQTGAQKADEQGFRGLRIDAGGFQAGVFLGKGYLTACLGDTVAETVLASLSNLPQGANALRAAPVAAKARQLLPPEPGLMYYVSDVARWAPGSLRELWRDIAPTRREFPRLKGKSAIDERSQKWQELLPAEDAMEGIFGVMVTQVVVRQQGLVFQHVLELPLNR